MLVVGAALWGPPAADAGPGDEPDREACVEQDALERLKITASYRSEGSGPIEVTDASVRLEPPDEPHRAKGDRRRPAESEFLYQRPARDGLRRRVSDRHIAVVTFHEVNAFERIAQLLVVVPCGAPERAVVADRGFSVPIGRSFLDGLERTGKDRWLVIGRNQGGDGGKYWGSVWAAELSSDGQVRVHSMLKYSSRKTGAALDVESYRYDTEQKTLELEVTRSAPAPQAGPPGERPGRTMTLVVPLGAEHGGP